MLLRRELKRARLRKCIPAWALPVELFRMLAWPNIYNKKLEKLGIGHGRVPAKALLFTYTLDACTAGQH
eukprot:109667-Lingulodinium_polyedra.AAC.1